MTTLTEWYDPQELTTTERLQQLERLIRKPTTLDDLPVAELRRDLELSWHPQGSVLLEPGSVKENVVDRGEYFPITAAMFTAPWRNIAGGGGANTDAHYWRDVSGVIHLDGVLDKNGGNFIVNDPILTLPSTHRPAKNLIFPSAMAGGGAFNCGQLNVLSTGVVTIGGIGGPANPVVFVSLCGISFRGQ